MSSNPYEAPVANVDAVETALEVPEEVEKRIRNAVGAGVISGCITLLICLIAMWQGGPIMGLDAWSLIDVVLIFGLTFGIYRKSRTCAVIMLIYYAGMKIMQVVTMHAIGGLIWGIIFSYLFAMGAVGTFQYRKIKREAQQG